LEREKKTTSSGVFSLHLYIIYLNDPFKIYNKKLWDIVYRDQTEVFEVEVSNQAYYSAYKLLAISEAAVQNSWYQAQGPRNKTF
jgi:hypothetical protein